MRQDEERYRRARDVKLRQCELMREKLTGMREMEAYAQASIEHHDFFTRPFHGSNAYLIDPAVLDVSFCSAGAPIHSAKSAVRFAGGGSSAELHSAKEHFNWSTVVHRHTVLSPEDGDAFGPGRRRRLSEKWMLFFKFIDLKGGATMDELDVYVIREMQSNKKVLREQLRYYSTQKLLRVDQASGVVFLTALGKAVSDSEKGEALSAGNTEGFGFQSAPSGDQS